MTRRRWLGFVAAVAAVALLAAWQWGPSLPIPWRQPSPEAPPFGPLAVARTELGPAARAEGPVRIRAACVVQVWPGGSEALLVWPADRVAWLPEGATIRFETTDGRSELIRDGDVVVFGGGALSPEQLEGGLEWVARPDAGCPRDEVWLVVDVLDVN